MTEIHLKAYGFRNIEQKLFRVAENVDRPQRTFHHVAKMLGLIMEQRFESQGRRGGGSWKKISEQWKARKAESGLDTRILFATHRLKNSLTDADHPDNIMITRRKELVWGTEVPYAARQDRERPFLKLTKADRVMLATTITSEFVSPFRFRGVQL